MSLLVIALCMLLEAVAKPGNGLDLQELVRRRPAEDGKPSLKRAVSVAPARAAQDSLDAKVLLDRVDDLFRGDSSHGRMTMKITTVHWHRELTVEFWSEGKEKFLMRILAPKKERNTKTLKVGRDIWNYLPKVKRIIKLPSSMMAAAWMGSHFTNDDLVQESNPVTDYSHTLLGRETIAGYEAYKIELKPKPETAVVWDKIIMWVAIKSYVPMKEEYYSERGELIRTMLFYDIKKMGGRVIPARFEVIEEKKNGHKTIMKLADVVFDRPIGKSIFSKQNLRRAKP